MGYIKQNLFSTYTRIYVQWVIHEIFYSLKNHAKCEFDLMTMHAKTKRQLTKKIM